MIIPHMFFVLFVAMFVLIGLAILMLPPKMILRYDRRMGYQIYKHASNELEGLKQARMFYRILGLLFVFGGVVMLVLTVMEKTGFGDTQVELHAGFVTRAGTAKERAGSRYRPFEPVDSFAAETQQVIVFFYAKKQAGGIAYWRWLFEDKLVKEYKEEYVNGFNHIVLKTDATYLPVGTHTVEIVEQGGSRLATIRFEIPE